MTLPLRSRFRFEVVAVLALLPLACGGPSCRSGCVQSDEWVELRPPKHGVATVTFTVANTDMTVIVDERGFREAVDANPALRPKGRARINELLDSGTTIEVGPGTLSMEARCFWMLTGFIEKGEARVSLDEAPLSRLRVRDVLYGNPEAWTAHATREYWTEDGVRLLEFATMLQ